MGFGEGGGGETSVNICVPAIMGTQILFSSFMHCCMLTPEENGKFVMHS